MDDSHTNSNHSKKTYRQNSRSFLNFSHAVHQSSQNHSRIEDTPHQINTNSHAIGSQGSTWIYGTNIETTLVKKQLIQFITEFQILIEVNGDTLSEKIYKTQLNDLDLDLEEKPIFTIYGKHLKEYDRDIYCQFIYFPSQMFTMLDQTIKELYEKLFIFDLQNEDQILRKTQKRDRIMTQMKGIDQIISLREINHKMINRLVSFKGIVIRCSEISPDMIQGYFKCCNCQNIVIVKLINAKVSEPKSCERCRLKETMEIIHNHCQFVDKQFVKFQQLPELVPEGETPSSITLISHEFNVDRLRPGDRIQIIGIYRVNATKVIRGQSNLKTMYNSYVDVISYGRLEDHSLKIFDDNDRQIIYNDDDKNLFMQIASSPTVIEDLVQSFAPSIYGHQQVKKGLLAQLFGGSKKDFQFLGRGRFRSDINICLVGDPSTAKSQLLQQVHKISPRGIYTSGRGSSAVGLTANVRKDPETKQFVLESGALVLSDLGICCIDEFDKMNPDSRLILLQAMEQQTISIAKAGIVCQLNSRAAILCAANPVNSRYNQGKSVVQNINLQPALLSRFDLIYILLDRPSQMMDKMLASHILSLYSQFQQKLFISNNRKDYSKQILAKYITYAKQYVTPMLDEKSADKLVEAYTDMRKLGNNKKVITATTRQLESLIRISEAFAKMRLSPNVQVSDIEEAIALVKFATQQAATDPNTGLIDMDVIVTGKTSSSRQKANKIKELALQIIKANITKYMKGTLNIESIRPEVEKKMDLGVQVNDEEMLEGLRLLESEGVVVLFGPSKQKPNFRLAKNLGKM